MTKMTRQTTHVMYAYPDPPEPDIRTKSRRGKSIWVPRQWAGFSHEHHHTHSNPSIHPFLSIHSIHSIHQSGTIAQLHIFSYIFFMNSTELELVVTLVDSTFYLYKYTYIHAAAAIGSQPSVIVGGYLDKSPSVW